MTVIEEKMHMAYVQRIGHYYILPIPRKETQKMFTSTLRIASPYQTETDVSTDIASIAHDIQRAFNDFYPLTNCESKNLQTKDTVKYRSFLSKDKTTSTIEVELPGIKKEDIELNIIENYLQLTYKDRQGATKAMQFSIGNAYDIATTDATCNDGLLVIKHSLRKPVKTQVAVK